jgi:hypothetical protein
MPEPVADAELAELLRTRDRLRDGLARCAGEAHREKVALQLEATDRWIARLRNARLAMRRETVEEKARRLLGEGRLLVEHVADGRVQAIVAGDSGMHELAVEADGAESCSCRASGRCSHLVALGLVTHRGKAGSGG